MKKKTIIALCALSVLGVAAVCTSMSYSSKNSADELLKAEASASYDAIVGEDAPLVAVSDSITN